MIYTHCVSTGLLPESVHQFILDATCSVSTVQSLLTQHCFKSSYITSKPDELLLTPTWLPLCRWLKKSSRCNVSQHTTVTQLFHQAIVSCTTPHLLPALLAIAIAKRCCTGATSPKIILALPCPNSTRSKPRFRQLVIAKAQSLLPGLPSEPLAAHLPQSDADRQ